MRFGQCCSHHAASTYGSVQHDTDCSGARHRSHTNRAAANTNTNRYAISNRYAIADTNPSTDTDAHPSADDTDPYTNTDANASDAYWSERDLWGYDFEQGNYITDPPADYCSGQYFSCVSSFENGTGYVVQCGDGLCSKSGGHKGSCSKHRGEQAIPYSH
ncbi:hypothetical protein KSF_042880 [Reticulibacter mediterranei]|uniref:Uncharacterized protein n=1 Tax=Reticulibacter mediterranei TaxID=2778369 RepID=A0A8J3N3I7_9CHLR|nr:hypothetical protein KSF_042880 [Reticulibacter mediterranei]